MKAIDSKEIILNKFGLKFINEKYENDYQIQISEKVKEANIELSLGNLIFSTSLLLFIFFIFLEVINRFNQLNFELRNTQDINLETKLSRRLYYFKFELINKTAEYNSEVENLYPQDDYSYLVRQKLFSKRCLPLIILMFFSFLVILLSSVLLKKKHHHRYISLIIYGLFGMNFHIVSGILSSLFNLTSDPIFFLVAIQLFLRILIIFRMRMEWLGVLSVTVLNELFEWILFMSFHYRVPMTIVYYFSVDTIMGFFCVILAYKKEIDFKYEFFLLRRLNFDNEYLVNFLYHMGQGFFTYNNKKVIFINAYMRKITKNFELINSSKSLNIRMAINNDLEEILERGSRFLDNAHFYPSDNDDYRKDQVERLFEDLDEVNLDLPNEVHEMLSMKINNANSNANPVNGNHLFHLDDFFNVVKKYEKFKNFTYLGKYKLKNNLNGLAGTRDEVIKINNQYEISARVIVHDNTDEYLEFIFNDISNVIKIERAKTITTCRSMYLSKIAHEFKNPISSLIELATRTNEESQNNNSQSLANISSMSDYSINICHIMNRFLNDFEIFTDLKIPCPNCYNFRECEVCKSNLLCKNCDICYTCVKKNEETFKFRKIIHNLNKTYEKLNNYEGKSHTFKLEINTNLEYIHTNKNLFQSILYNLIYYSYKSDNHSEINIKVEEADKDHICFEISNTGMEIKKEFIDNLNTMNMKLEENPDESGNEINSDRFNKNFKINISFSLARRIGSFLKIKSDISGNKFSLIVLCNKNEVVNPDMEVLELQNNARIRTDVETISDKSDNESQVTQIFVGNFEFLCERERESLLEGDSSFHILYKEKKPENLEIHDFEENELQFKSAEVIRFLIIDDEVLVRKAIIRHLKRLNEEEFRNYEIEFYEAENCFLAIELIYNKFVKKKKINCVIIDEYMPFMKGSTMIRLMKNLSSENNFYNLNFVSYTAFSSDDKKGIILDAGADFVINKPASYGEFKNLIIPLINKMKNNI